METFNKLGYPLKVIGGGPDFNRIKAMAGSNVEILGKIDDGQVAELMARCKAFVFAADEDFGIVPVEAQAAGALLSHMAKAEYWKRSFQMLLGYFWTAEC